MAIPLQEFSFNQIARHKSNKATTEKVIKKTKMCYSINPYFIQKSAVDMLKTPRLASMKKYKSPFLNLTAIGRWAGSSFKQCPVNIFANGLKMFERKHLAKFKKYAVFPEPCFSGGQLTPAFKNRGSMQIFEGQ